MSRRFIVSILIGLAIVAVLRVAGALTPIENAVRYALLPLARSSSSFGRSLGSFLEPKPNVNELIDRNRDFEARLNAIVVDYVRLRSLEEENRSLRSMLTFVDSSTYDFVPARIISRSTDLGRAEVLIDKGARDGLETGMAVIAEEGLFVGKIIELQDRLSLVTLVSDDASRIAAAKAGREELIGIVEGRGNRAAQLTLIPQQIEMERDDIVVTSGTEDKIPANLPIGLINDIEGEPTDPFKQASLEPLAQIDRLNLVLVLRPSVLRPDDTAL